MHSRIHANLFEKAMAKNKPSQKKPAQKKTQATKTPRKKTLVVRAFQEAPVRPTPAPRVAQPFKKSNTDLPPFNGTTSGESALPA